MEAQPEVNKPNSKPVDQTPPLDPADAIHAKVLAMDELALHTRRAELLQTPNAMLSIDELTELCAVLACLKKRKSGPPADSAGKTRKRLKDTSGINVHKLEL